MILHGLVQRSGDALSPSHHVWFRTLPRGSGCGEASQPLAPDDTAVLVADLQIGKDQIWPRNLGGDGTGHHKEHARPLSRKGGHGPVSHRGER